MQPGARKQFITFLTACAEVYGKPLSDAVMGVWWEALRPYEIDAVQGAFSRHIQSPDNGQFMPKPADIIRMLTGTSLDGSMVAWAKVDKAVRSVGPYASVTFDDPIVQRVLQDMGGWIAFGAKTDDEWPFIGNEFRTRYQGYRHCGEMPEYPRTLIGIAEAENSKRGIGTVDLVLIGDATKAQQVRDGGVDRPQIGFHRLPANDETLLLEATA